MNAPFASIKDYVPSWREQQEQSDRYFGRHWDFLNDNFLNEFTITMVDGGTDAGQVRACNGLGGVFTLTNNDADNDNHTFQEKAENILFSTGLEEACFYGEIKVGDADQTDWFLGFGITDTTGLVPGTGSEYVTDLLGLKSDDGDASIDLAVEKNAADNTYLGEAGLGTIEDDTYIKLGVHVTPTATAGEARIRVYINGVKVKDAVYTTVPDDEALAFSFAFQNGTAAAHTMTSKVMGYRGRLAA